MIAAALALVLASAATPGPVLAATLTVNSVDDEPDDHPGDGVCRSTITRRCTLRAAIMEANALPGPDTINLPSATFRLTISGLDDVAALGDLDITGELTITGAGPTLTIIDASTLAQRDRVFDMQPHSVLTLQGLRITGGLAQNVIGGSDGGGIRVLDWGTLALANVVVDGNQAQSVGGAMTLRAHAGAVLDNSTIDNNQAVLDGGGISTNDGSALGIDNSTISRNRSGRDGGGIRYIGAQFYASNSTISTNTAMGRGGGLFVDIRGTVTGLGGTFVTVAYNVASTAMSGANIYSASASGSFKWEMRRSIVSNGSQGGNCGGLPLLSQGFNLEDQNTCGFTAAGDMIVTNPLLRQLGFDNSTTRVHPLPRNSPAVDVIPDCRGFDQRNVSRPKDGNLDGIARCDIGAYELDNR
jgi:CSLREA domain-containing protein